MTKFSFELFTQRNLRRTNTQMRVSLCQDKRFVLNQLAFEALGRPEAVLLLFDRENKVIGLQPCKRDAQHAYVVRKQGKANSYTISVTTFCRYCEIPAATRYVFEPFLDGEILALAIEKAVVLK